jgi:hypothetical protein
MIWTYNQLHNTWRGVKGTRHWFIGCLNGGFVLSYRVRRGEPWYKTISTFSTLEEAKREAENGR